MAGRALKWGGGFAAAGAGYYFYKAGGDPKAAQKRFESDAHKVEHKLKGDAPSEGKKLGKDVEILAADARSEAERVANQTRDQTHKVDAKLEEYRASASKSMDDTMNKTGKELNKAVDAFDKNVQEGTSKAQSGISSWFGGK